MGCADNQYYKLTKEIIISEFSKMSKAREFEDEIWLVSIDRMMDYSGYFAQDNSHNLDKKYSVETRKARQGEKTGAWVNCHQIPE